MPGRPGTTTPTTPSTTSSPAAIQSRAGSTAPASSTLRAMSRAEPPPGWSAEKMAALGARHAELEARGDLAPLLATLAPDPVYEFHPMRRCMRGDDRVRR